MNILVVNTAAEHSGALKLLQCVYKEITEYSDEHHFYIMISVPQLEEPATKNITILRYPQAKQSFFKRLFCDTFEITKLIKKHNIDIVFSLQNTLLPSCKGTYKALYMQQSLQYLNDPYKKDNFKTWFRKKVIGSLIHFSAKRADSVYVQTQWIKERLRKEINCENDKIHVVEPNANIDSEKYKFVNKPENYKTFFYPAVASPYKNHMVILQAAKKLIERGTSDFKIVFTIGTNTEYEKNLKKFALDNNLNVEFCGRLPYEKVLEMYTHSVLIFASDIETFGFPMREMSIIGGPVLVTKRPYAYDVVGDYDNSLFFEHKDSNDLSDKMKQLVDGQYPLSLSTYPGKNKILIDEVINVYKKQTLAKKK